jgi:hypothetical protein
MIIEASNFIFPAFFLLSNSFFFVVLTDLFQFRSKIMSVIFFSLPPFQIPEKIQSSRAASKFQICSPNEEEEERSANDSRQRLLNFNASSLPLY